jgi:hypothetical protein
MAALPMHPIAALGALYHYVSLGTVTGTVITGVIAITTRALYLPLIICGDACTI